MRKLILIVFCILFLAVNVGAQSDTAFVQYSTKTSSALVTTGKGLYHGIKVRTDGTNAQTITVCDDTSVTCATQIEPESVWPSSSTVRKEATGSNPPRRYYKGLYIIITGSGTRSVDVEFTPE